nr:suppressor of gamma response 1 [Tanacetum cinerariifolium]
KLSSIEKLPSMVDDHLNSRSASSFEEPIFNSGLKDVTYAAVASVDHKDGKVKSFKHTIFVDIVGRSCNSGSDKNVDVNSVTEGQMLNLCSDMSYVCVNTSNHANDEGSDLVSISGVVTKLYHLGNDDSVCRLGGYNGRLVLFLGLAMVCGLKWPYDNRELASGGNDIRIILCRYPLARVNQAWTGLPCGVKFDPLDHQIMWHLLAKSGASGFQPNPSTDEFIPTVVKDEGISYIHPQKLPGNKKQKYEKISESKVSTSIQSLPHTFIVAVCYGFLTGFSMTSLFVKTRALIEGQFLTMRAHAKRNAISSKTDNPKQRDVC